jgi:N-acetylglucosamine transport system permease protein
MEAIMTKNKSRLFFIFLSVVPAFLLYCIFFLYPCLRGISLSLFDWRGLSLNMRFSGLNNFFNLFKDENFYISLKNNIFVYIFTTIVLFSTALFFAASLSKQTLKEKGFYKTLFFFPTALPASIIGVLAMMTFSGFGLLNSVIDLMGIDSLQNVWLSNPKTVLPVICIVLAWKVVGFYMVLFIAAIQNIPIELYEASYIDGAGPIRQTLQITLPLIWEVVRTAMIFFIITSFQASFSIVFMVTRGGPDRASEVLATYLYEKAFRSSQYGYGTAIGVFILVISMGLALVLLRITKRKSVEY